MTTMDFWYDLASREPAALNEEATYLLREAAEALRVSSEPPDYEDE